MKKIILLIILFVSSLTFSALDSAQIKELQKFGIKQKSIDLYIDAYNSDNSENFEKNVGSYKNR